VEDEAWECTEMVLRIGGVGFRLSGGVLFIVGGARSVAAAGAGAPGVEAAGTATGAGENDASVDGEIHLLCLSSANIFRISPRRNKGADQSTPTSKHSFSFSSNKFSFLKES
jgi:hypothetical protein